MRVSDNGCLFEWRRCCQAYDRPKATQQISHRLRVSISTSTSSTCNYVVNLVYGRANLDYISLHHEASHRIIYCITYGFSTSNI